MVFISVFVVVSCLSPLGLQTTGIAQKKPAQQPKPSDQPVSLQERIPTQVDPRRLSEMMLPSWDFENGLNRWTKEGTAFDNQPTLGDNVVAERVRHDMNLASGGIGGDYWKRIPYPVGHQGNYWIGTYENRPDPDSPLGAVKGDGPTGRLTSGEFAITKPYIHFLIGGGNDSNREKVELQVFGLGPAPMWMPVRSATGRNSEVLRREVWDVRQLLALKVTRARIVIVDESSGGWGHINVDDIQFSDSPPAPGPNSRDQNAPVWGFADPHAHLMSHMGFGRRLFWGRPFDPDPRRDKTPEERLRDALGWCTPSHGLGGVSLNAEFGHLVGGYPEFNGWPRFTSTVHQQAYIDWIKRAYDGGLRLVTMLATNAELMAARYVSQDEIIDPAGGVFRATAGALAGVRYHDDLRAIEDQIRAMREVVQFVDNQSGGPGRGWLEIATTPQEARRIIGQNKLAVILGIEVDSFGNWRTPEDLHSASGGDLARARAIIRAELQRLYGLGVRQVYPIHLTDNAFGGAAIYHRTFDALNLFVTGHHYTTESDATNTVSYRIEQDLGAGSGFTQTVARFISYGLNLHVDPSWNAFGGHVNARALTDYGRIMIEEMMNLHMIIDVDHMGQKMLDQALSIVQSRNYPVISSHSGFRELAIQPGGTSDSHKLATETLKRPDQVETIRRLGGMVAPITIANDVRDVGSVIPSLRGRVANDAPGSAKTWAQNYLYAVTKMGGQGVALASDINGMAGMPGPRFGTFASYALHEDIDVVRRPLRRGFINAQQEGVKYNTPIKDFRWYRFEETGPGAYDMEERDIWEAVAMFKAGFNPWIHNLGPPGENTPPTVAGTFIPTRLGWQQNKINNIAKGLWAADEERRRGVRRDLENPVLFGGDTYAEQRAAYLVGMSPTRDTGVDPPRVRELFPRIEAIWNKWKQMENAASQTQPLTRSMAGRREFDINLDGFAHYGMLPDFLQDLRNVGLTHEDLTPLFRSAEDYIRMWEKCMR
jgi:microsomal dipeptidase-like Zn-dependent dipeptidase